MPRTLKLLATAALFAVCCANARAQSGVRTARQDEAKPRTDATDDALKAEQLCEQARAARGAGGEPEAGKAFERAVKLYLRVYTKARPVEADEGGLKSFRERMRERLAGAPRCVEEYLALGAGTPSERAQLEAFRAHAAILVEPDDSRTTFLGSEVDRRALVTRKPHPGFTEEARRNDVRGKVRLRAVLASDGAVRHVFVLEGLPHGMTEECVAAAKGIRFEPAVKDGRPVSQFVSLEYNFNTH